MDGYHSKYGVLAYDRYVIALPPLLTTSAWVPPTFALAGVLMSILYLGLDSVFNTPPADRSPSVPKVLQGIALFTFQYYLSGILAGRLLMDYGPLNGILFVLAGACFALFDRTKASAWLAGWLGWLGVRVL